MKKLFASICVLALAGGIAHADDSATTTNGSVSTATGTNTNHDTWTLNRHRFPRVKKTDSSGATGTPTGTKQ